MFDGGAKRGFWYGALVHRGIKIELHADCGFGDIGFGYRGIRFVHRGIEFDIHVDCGFGDTGFEFRCFWFVYRGFKIDDHAVCGYRDSGFVYRGIQRDACADGGYWGGFICIKIGRPDLLFAGLFRRQGAMALAGHIAFPPGL